MSPPQRRLALQYVPRFTCLAAECRENCCTGLRVELTESNYQTLTGCAAAIPKFAERVTELVQIERSPTSRSFAHVEANGKACPFLDTDWLCSIHRDLTEVALADPCSLFPRVLTEVSGTLELSATLACPEAARLCLTAEDSTDVVEFDTKTMAREIVVRRHEASSLADGGDPYVALFEDIRQICLDVIRSKDVSVEVALLLLVDFAARIDPIYHAGMTSLAADELQAAIALIPARVAVIEEIVKNAPRGGERALRGLQEILLARLPSCDNQRFHTLVRPAVLSAPNADLERIKGYFHGDAAVGLATSVVVARARAAHTHLAALRPRMDDHARRYATNSIVKDWHTQRPTLGSSLRRLVVRLALSRFVLLMGEVSKIDGPAALDEASVDAFQIIAKNVEHVPTFMDLCESYMVEQKLDDLPNMAGLLRV